MAGFYPLRPARAGWLLAVVLFVPAAVLPAAQAPAPLLSGRVVDADGAAVPGADIRAYDDDTRVTIAGRGDEQGRFVMGEREAGRYVVTATAPGFLPGRYGALAHGQPGVPLRVGAGVRATDVEIVLERPGVIHGRVVDVDGKPVPAAVHAMTSRWNGARHVLARVAAAMTDADGRYTIGGLPPQEFVMLAMPAGGAAFTPAFHPNATSVALAARVIIGAAADVHGVDIAVSPATGAELGVRLRAGGLLVYPSIVVVPDDTGDAALQADTSPTDRRLSIPHVGAGRHTVIGTALEVSSAGALERRWATQSIEVDGRQPVDLVLDLGPGASIEGRVVLDALEASTVERPDNWLWPWDEDRPLGLLPFAGVLAASAGGRFTISGIAPGRYVLQFGRDAGAQPPGWAIADVRMHGDDVADLPIDLLAGDRHEDVEIVLTSRETELGGTLTTADGRPRSDVTLVAFAADSRYWWSGTRRIRLARPDTSGYYRMRGLPAGDYLLVAVSGAIPTEPADPQWLGSLTPGAVPLHLPPGGRVVQDLNTPGVFLTRQKDAGGVFSCQLPVPDVDEAGENPERGHRDE